MSQNHISERHGSGKLPEVTLHGTTGHNYGTKATYRSHGSDAREAHALETGSRSNSLRPPSAGSGGKQPPRPWSMPARWKLLGIAFALIMVCCWIGCIYDYSI